MGCPIRTSEDHRALAPSLGFSQRATSFIAFRYQGIHQMPFVLRPRPAPSTQDQRSDDRGQMSDHPCRPPCAIRDRCANAAPCRCSGTGSTHTHAPGPTSPLLRGDGRTCFTVTTRFTISTEQRTEDGTTRRSGAPVLRHNSRSRRQQTRPETSLSFSVLRPRSSALRGPGPS